MSRTVREQVEGFFRSLEQALGGAEDQAREIVAEVRADFDEHLDRFKDEGASEDEAAERALAEMGNPFELAHKMRREVPPFAGKPVRVVRYLLASGILLWLLFLLWHMRAWTYGFDPTIYALFGGLHLPVIVLLWPRIVWKKNWMFRISLATAGAVALAVVSFLGQKETGEVAALPTGALETIELAPTLSGPASRSGVVKSSGGHVVGNARVSWSRGPDQTWDYSSEDGSFSLEGLPDGEIVVGVTCRGREVEWFTLPEADEPAELVLSIPHSEASPLSAQLELQVEDSDGSPGYRKDLYLISAALGVFALGLFLSMQQSSQRRRFLLAIAASVGAIEIPFQVEEALFRQDRDTLRSFAESRRAQGKALSEDRLSYVLLDSEECPPELEELGFWNDRISLDAGEDFTIWWHRPLCRGFSIGYHSSDGDTWIQD